MNLSRTHRLLTVAAATGTALIAAPAAQAKTVTVKDSGKSVTLRVGDRLAVDVAENPSTGYAWQTVTLPSILVAAGSKYTANPASAGLVGGGGRRVITFRAKKRGTGTLRLRYRRPTDPQPLDRTFTVRVTVRP